MEAEWSFPYREHLANIERTLNAAANLAEVVEDFLASEYPVGTAHTADSEADRLRRAIESYRLAERMPEALRGR